MKKIFGLLVFLFLLYFGIQIAFRYLDKGHIYEYTLNKDKHFKIKETLTQNKDNEFDNYYFEITVDDVLFNIKTSNTYNRATGIIKDIKYFSNTNYTCILPILYNHEIISDIICKKNDKYYYYNSLKGNDAELDKFAEDNLDLTKFVSSAEVLKKNSNMYVYDNIVNNHYIAVDYFKGIYDINKIAEYRKIKIFENEKYGRKISTIVGKYYVSANYDKDYDFHIFKTVNLENYNIGTITSDYEISFDSYVQGVVNNSFYVFDRSNKKQYKIDVINKEVTQIGNENGIKIYKDGEFIDGNAYEASQREITFNEYNTDNTFNNKQYSKVEKVGNVNSGYIYVYEKVNNKYDVYRASVQNNNILIYLFTTTDIDSIKYINDYVYFKDSKDIKYFNQATGIKTLARYDDLEFNNELKFYIYSK